MATDSERLRVSRDGTIGGISWRGDGEELYFVNQNLDTEDEFNDIKLMAVDVTTTPELRVGERFLFVVAAE